MKDRDIKKELEERKLKDALYYFKETIKTTYKVNKKGFILVIFLSIVEAVFPVLMVILLKEVINNLLEGLVLIMPIVLYIVIYILEAFIYNIRDKYKELLQTEIDYSLRAKLGEKLTELRIEDFEGKELHDNYRRAQRGIGEAKWLYQSTLNITLSFVTLLSFGLIILFWKWWIVIMIIIYQLIFMKKRYKRLENEFVTYWQRSTLERKGDYYQWIMGSTNIMMELKGLNAYKYIFGKYFKVKTKLFEEDTKIIKKRAFLDIVLSLTDSIMTIVFLGIAFLEVYLGKILIGTFYLYQSALTQVDHKINNISINLALISIRLLYSKEYIEFLNYKTDFIEGDKKLDKIKTIEFINVAYKYKNNKKYAIKNINFKVEAGEKIAFIGENGSGKSTVMKLLMKIHVPTKGKILINGIDLKEYNTESVRERIAILFQDFNMYEDTVKENIELGKKSRSNDKIYESFAFPDFKKDINNMNKGINTILGSWFGDGSNLSKGQLQKLALCRIFYRNNEVLLLDEPNSALDPVAEKNMFDYILKKKKSNTCILTLHVFTNIKRLDRILMFKKGNLIEDGTHEDLYKNSKNYREYYDL